jgi:hypothetical protein
MREHNEFGYVSEVVPGRVMLFLSSKHIFKVRGRILVLSVGICHLRISRQRQHTALGLPQSRLALS